MKSNLHNAIETEYRRQEKIYLRAKRERMDGLVLTTLSAMNTLQRVLENAGLPKLEEKGESK